MLERKSRLPFTSRFTFLRDIESSLGNCDSLGRSSFPCTGRSMSELTQSEPETEDFAAASRVLVTLCPGFAVFGKNERVRYRENGRLCCGIYGKKDC